MKDPAVLWYFNDWHGGTITLSRFLKGCYMDLLHAQFNSGHLSLDEIKTVLGSDFGSAWPALQKKFVTDGDGLYYNERLLFEHQKRREYKSGRLKNLKSEKSTSHMEYINENHYLFFLIPNTWDLKIFNDYWVEFSKSRKKKLTERAAKLNLKDLVDLAGEDWGKAKSIMEMTIKRGWLSFFPPKEEKHDQPKSRYGFDPNFKRDRA